MFFVARAGDHVFEMAAIVFDKGRRELPGLAPPGLRSAAQVLVLQDGSDTRMIGEGLVEGDFVVDPKADEDGHGHSDGEAADVDGGGKPVPEQVTQGDPEIILKHGDGFAVLSGMPVRLFAPK